MRDYLKRRIMARDGRQGVKGTGRYGIGGSRYDRNSSRDYDDRERDYPRSDFAYSQRGNSQGGRGSQRGGQSYGHDRNYDYDMRYDDYDQREDFEYNYDMHEKPLEISKKDIKEWKKEVKNADGSTGAKFEKDQILPMAKQIGIEFEEDEFTEDEFVMTVNMMYSDYCRALQESGLPNYQRPEPYIFLAKAFLEDEDFDGKPYEKLALYFYGIVEFDD